MAAVCVVCPSCSSRERGGARARATDGTAVAVAAPAAASLQPLLDDVPVDPAAVASAIASVQPLLCNLSAALAGVGCRESDSEGSLQPLFNGRIHRFLERNAACGLSDAERHEAAVSWLYQKFGVGSRRAHKHRKWYVQYVLLLRDAGGGGAGVARG